MNLNESESSMKQMTKTQAISKARQQVSDLCVFGENYRFSVYDADRKAWRETHPQDYWAARAQRSCVLIQLAREALGFTDGDQYVQFAGGSWTDYLGE